MSDELEVSGFFRGKFGVFTAWMSENTNGWTKEKQEWRVRLMEKTLDQIQDFEAKENAKALMVIMGAFRHKIQGDNARSRTIAELEKLWKIFMTMNGKVTSITRQLEAKDEEPTFNYSDDAKKRAEKYSKKDT